jgi:hypothetical protein
VNGVAASQLPEAGGGASGAAGDGTAGAGVGDGTGGTTGATAWSSPGLVDGPGDGAVVAGIATVTASGALPAPGLPAASVWNAVTVTAPPGRLAPVHLQTPPETTAEQRATSAPDAVSAKRFTVASFSPVPEYTTPVPEMVLPDAGDVTIGAPGASTSREIVRAGLGSDWLPWLNDVD